MTTAKLIFGSVDEQAKGAHMVKLLWEIFGIGQFSRIFTGLVVGKARLFQVATINSFRRHVYLPTQKVGIAVLAVCRLVPRL